MAEICNKKPISASRIIARAQALHDRKLSLDDVRNLFSLPDSLGAPQEQRQALDMAFDRAGGFSMLHASLTAHALELGQYPMSSFVGYGVLQQIQQNALIRACVQTIADDITHKWIRIVSNSDSESDEDNEKVEQLQKALDKYYLDKVFNKACTVTGYMGGALIYIDTGCSEADLEFPLRISDKSAELKFGGELDFTVVEPVNVCPAEYNTTNPLKKDYMMPRRWWVQGKLVHASRFIQIVDNPVCDLLKPSYNFFGIPQAQLLWDYVMHFNDSRNSVNELLKKISLLVVQTDTQQIFSEAGGLDNFDLRMQALQLWRDNNSVFVCDKTEEGVTNVQTSIGGTSDIVRQNLELISAINRTPAVKLLGISPSGFNATGESDIKNYHEALMSKKNLLWGAIDRCIKAIQLVEFGHIDPSLTFEFESLDAEDENTVAMSNQTRAGMLTNLAQSQIISAEEARTAVKNDPRMNLSFLSKDMPSELQGGAEEPSENPFEGLLGSGAENAQRAENEEIQDQNA